jgi:hypothetical protein
VSTIQPSSSTICLVGAAALDVGGVPPQHPGVGATDEHVSQVAAATRDHERCFVDEPLALPEFLLGVVHIRGGTFVNHPSSQIIAETRLVPGSSRQAGEQALQYSRAVSHVSCRLSRSDLVVERAAAAVSDRVRWYGRVGLPVTIATALQNAVAVHSGLTTRSGTKERNFPVDWASVQVYRENLLKNNRPGT